MTRPLSWRAIATAAAIPVVVVALVIVLLNAQGTPQLRLAGVPADELKYLRPASESEVTINRGEAVDRARDGAPSVPGDAPIRQAVVARYQEHPDDATSDRLVWVVSFDDPDSFGAFPLLGGDHLCDWALHRVSYISIVDARTGDWLTGSQIGVFDPFRPPHPDLARYATNVEFCQERAREERAESAKS